MIKKIKGIKIELIIISVVLFALGLFLVIFPEISQLVICRVVGIALCVWGVLRLITYFRMAKEEVIGIRYILCYEAGSYCYVLWNSACDCYYY